MTLATLEIRNDIVELKNNFHYLIGNTIQCNIRLEDNSVDSLHASLLIKDNIYLTDLNSKNGTFFNKILLEKFQGTEITKSCSVKFGKVLATLKLDSTSLEKKYVSKRLRFTKDENTLSGARNRNNSSNVIQSSFTATSSNTSHITSTPNYCKNSVFEKSHVIINNNRTSIISINNSSKNDSSFYVPETQFAENDSSSDSTDSNDLFGKFKDKGIRENILCISKQDDYYVPETQEHFSAKPRNKPHNNANDLKQESKSTCSQDYKFSDKNSYNELMSQNLFADLMLTQTNLNESYNERSDTINKTTSDDEIQKINWQNSIDIVDNHSNCTTPDCIEVNNETFRSYNSPIAISSAVTNTNKNQTTPEQNNSIQKKLIDDYDNLDVTQDFLPKILYLSDTNKSKEKIDQLVLFDEFSQKQYPDSEHSSLQKIKNIDKNKQQSSILIETETFVGEELCTKDIFVVKPDESQIRLLQNNDFLPKSSYLSDTNKSKEKIDQEVSFEEFSQKQCPDTEHSSLQKIKNIDKNKQQSSILIETETFVPDEELCTKDIFVVKPDESQIKLLQNNDFVVLRSSDDESIENKFIADKRFEKSKTEITKNSNDEFQIRLFDESQIRPFDKSQIKPLRKNNYVGFSSPDDENINDESIYVMGFAKTTTEIKKNSDICLQENVSLKKNLSNVILTNIDFNVSKNLDSMRTPTIDMIKGVRFHNKLFNVDSFSTLDLFKFNDFKKNDPNKTVEVPENKQKVQVKADDISNKILRSRSKSNNFENISSSSNNTRKRIEDMTAIKPQIKSKKKKNTI